MRYIYINCQEHLQKTMVPITVASYEELSEPQYGEGTFSKGNITMSTIANGHFSSSSSCVLLIFCSTNITERQSDCYCGRVLLQGRP